MAPIEASSFDFPHPVLTKIGDNNTEPTFASILIAHVELNANAASIYSARGDGLQGHLALTIAANDYIERSLGNKPFEPPTAPPAFPSHSDTSSDAQFVETNRQHKARKEEFILYHNADTALRNLLIAAVPLIFLADQRDPMTGFGKKTVLQLLTYLHTTFGSISEKDLYLNTARMQLQWTPPLQSRHCSSSSKMESLSLPQDTMPPPSQPSSDGHTTIWSKQVASILLVANGARWIRAPKTG
jgi:hypothetical protein